MKLDGIHHITAITGDAQRNVDFYAGVLGLRLVKKTVNQDDPTVYHLFFADEKGDAGSDLTFFEYPGAPPGRPGDGMIWGIRWRLGTSDALDFWTERLNTRDEEIALTWYQLGEPFLVHTQPNTIPGRPYGMCTVLIPALGARLTRNGSEAKGRAWPRDREGRPSSTCVLGLCESWTQAK